LPTESFESGVLFFIRGRCVFLSRLSSQNIVKAVQQFVWITLNGCISEQIALT
jgi:hypothetical protein